ncbi:SCO4225 family membrane protein [Nonomuraea sp. CA-218870]|uniref:SCO4225 family membrane protein n=1 Tax=Nonomuraea sp. CA-218870 TaxID=3239998 RepID=UPI003D92032A
MRLFRTGRRYVSRFDRGVFAASLAGGYALVVIAAMIFVAISTRQADSQGLEGLVLIAVTAPISMLLMYLPLAWLPQEVVIWLYPASGLLQAWLLWVIARGRRKVAASTVV